MKKNLFKNDLTISVIGLGYVGSSLSILLAQHFNVKVFDTDKGKLKKIQERNFSFIDDPEITRISLNGNLSLKSAGPESIFLDSKVFFLCLPTNLDHKTNKLNVDLIDTYVDKILNNAPDSIIVIRSTVPIGYTKSLIKKFQNESIIFSPEFLQEGKSISDNLYPSRIIIGGKNLYEMDLLQKILTSFSLNQDPETLFMSPCEAESVKLFSNMYLSTRIAFFNELDSFALSKGLDSSKIIQGVSMDNRIGNYYNNPSFGFGGYCLPKDAKQLESDFEEVPQSLISSVLISNEIRKNEIVRFIKKNKIKRLGIFRLENKINSKNYRNSVMLDIISMLDESKISILIFDETIIEISEFRNCVVYKNLNKFKKESQLILANRMSEALSDVKEKVFTRDVFNRN